MEQRGFIHNMMDVKVLILFVLSQTLYPVDVQKLYELCYQDDCLSYFDLSTAVPQMVESGHIEQTEPGKYAITQKGRDAEEVTHDSIAYPVLQRAQQAVERFNRDVRRDNLIHTEILPREGGDFSVVMGLDDENGNLMTLELLAPSQQEARSLAKAFHKSAENIFQDVMTDLLGVAEPKDDADV
jgi:hypothetical protein